jgi:hypothetical protein
MAKAKEKAKKKPRHPASAAQAKQQTKGKGKKRRAAASPQASPNKLIRYSVVNKHKELAEYALQDPALMSFRRGGASGVDLQGPPLPTIEK